MGEHPRKSRGLDLLAGFTAIVLVLASAILTPIVGSDLRALFALTGTAFFLAGVVRGQSVVHNSWSHGVLVSCPGLLGTAALIMNDGFHRLPVPIALALISILMTVAGIQARRWWNAGRRKSWLLAAGAAGSLTIVALAGVPALSTYASLERVDRPVAQFALTTFDGRSIKSSELQGHVVVLAFWATWCLPCHRELPELEAVYKRFENDSGVIFLAVDADLGAETAAAGKSFFARKKFELPGAYDSGGAGRALGVDSLPTVVVLDQEGHVRMTHHGYDASEHVGAVLAQTIEELLHRS